MSDPYVFPDEQDKLETVTHDKLEIEIEDDTPPEDRGRAPMPKNLVEELEKDELEVYDDAVKTKLKQMKKVWHDERRDKEQALREHQEAVAFTKLVLEENNRMKNMIHNGEKEYISAISHSANVELEMAKRAYKAAYDAGDTDKVIEASAAMNGAQLRIEQAKNFKLPPLQNQEFPVKQQVQSQSSSEPDHKAVEWQKRNAWFGPNKRMTAAALGIHEELKDEGVSLGSDEYYESLDKELRSMFPKEFEPPVEKSSKPKPSTVVAPATRSTSSNKIKLKASQVQLAKKLGLTPEQYAKAVIAQEAKHG